MPEVEVINYGWQANGKLRILVSKEVFKELMELGWTAFNYGRTGIIIISDFAFVEKEQTK